ncbi:hypothetical protein [Falsiroseomonas sp. E2-1-a4]|uniref:hypothetical protein n=1 Tax=Falsiroseomonas sp. E2-1-a4 TaxID=3239299 RepID=UPI003F314C22
MTPIRTMLLSAAALLLAAPIAATDALAQGYPRVTGTGENMMVEYGPMGQGNLAGGGRVMVTEVSGMDVQVVHLDALFAKTPREGYVAMTIGSGESQETVYVPAAMVEMLRRARGTQR